MSAQEFTATPHQGFSVFPLAAFSDNYIWCIQPAHSSSIWVVDPGDADVVLATLQQKQLQLAGILLTHHHRDHTGGVAKLQQSHPREVPVYGPQNPLISGVNQPLTQSAECQLACDDAPPLTARVYPVPGHTLDHLAYVIDDALFCGDTLFCAGCGRLFEGTPEQLYQSLQRLAALPDTTRVYCAHEYTLANLKFALAVEPHNPSLQTFYRQAQQLRLQQRPTLPSSIGLERAINPFLHCEDERLQTVLSEHWQCTPKDAVTRLKLLRSWKDNF
ncbi:hydroxyacylglutathione hydrolase [Shewanella sp. YIC-542]|uniref:hydroxyacylglutathione hydrolase n=1 Tax=Shewanella mytili TaxID=3377111 RepID=UPI00398E9ED6